MYPSLIPFPLGSQKVVSCESVSVLDVHLYHSFIFCFTSLGMVIYLPRLHQVLAVAQELCVAARGLSCRGSRACRLSSRNAWASLLHST